MVFFLTYMTEAHDRSCQEFQKQQREYFTELLVHKWECDTAGHLVCVPTKDGKHHQLSEDRIALWVEALVRDSAHNWMPKLV